MNACMKVYMNEKPSIHLPTIAMRVENTRFVHVSVLVQRLTPAKRSRYFLRLDYLSNRGVSDLDEFSLKYHNC